MLLNLGESPEAITRNQTLKGVAYVIVTATLAYFYLAETLRRQHQTLKALRQSERKYRELLEHANSVILRWTRDGRILFLNEFGQRFFGYSEAEIVGQHIVGTIVPEIESTGRNLRSLVDRICADPVIFEKNVNENIRRNGEKVWIAWTNKVYLDDQGRVEGILSIGNDITDRKRAEEALRESEEKFRLLTRQSHALLDAIPDNITRQSPDLRVIWANRGAAAGLKKEATALVGNYCYSLWHNRTSACKVCPVLETFRTGEPALEIVTTPDGKTWELRSVPVKEDGSVVEVVEIGRDVTENRKLEKQLLTAQRMESVGTLAGGIAHDFNNALTGIIGFAEMLELRVSNDPEALSDVGQILRSAERASVLTRHLLTFARRQIVEFGNLDLNQVIADIEKLLRRVTREDIVIRTDLAERVPTILADQGQLEQVLMNLCLNARDAMPKGGQLLVKTEEAWLDEETVKRYPYMKAGRYALLSVSDTGVGMDEKTRERIFEPFFTTKRPEKGTGLGLAVVYGIVKQHNGFIHVYSEPGKGTTIRIYFPAIDAFADAKVAASRGIIRGGSETILVADDDESIRNLAEKILGSYGYKVLVACDGEEAVDVLRRHADDISMVVLDVVMPKKGGKQAFDEMAKTAPGLKVLFMSGYSLNAVHESFVLHPGIPLMQKPFGPGVLARKVREVLG